MTYITYLGTFCSHGTPVWPWPVIITGPGGWPRTVGHDLKFESTGGKMMLAPHSARRVETRRAE